MDLDHFETTAMNWCAGAYSYEIFPNFSAGDSGPKFQTTLLLQPFYSCLDFVQGVPG